MKPSMLALLIAAGAFGASTIYLGVQLQNEREQADAFAEQARALSARVAELDKIRAELAALKLAGGPLAQSNKPEPGKPAAVLELAQSESTRDSAESPQARGFTPAPPERTEAMQKMMRTQLRANFKRVHADIGEKLGLSQDEANKLIDLMIDQQMAMMDRGRLESGNSSLTPEQRAAANQAQMQKNQAEVTALIGADKVEAYKAYQETMPARQEVAALSRQLEANDVNLSKDQRDRMVTALAEERNRVPAPKYSESASREDFNKAMSAWQDDYNQRTATRAGSILSSEQQATFSEFQQWTREMRQQSESRRAAREGPGQPR